MKISAVLRHRLFSILILAILFSTLLNAQMKIKERVSISPVQAPLLSTASGGEFTVQFQFDGELDPASASEVFVNQGSPCYAVYWGDRQATAPIMTGNFFAVIYLYARSPGTATYSYTANGQELMSVTMTISTSSWIIPFSCDFYESFKFDHDSVVVAPGTWENANIYGDGATICQPNAQWCPYYLTTWTVDQGSEWGQFYDENSKPVGTTYTARAADITGLAFQLSPNIPDTAFCIIKASSNGIDRYKKIYPPNYFKPELVVMYPTDNLLDQNNIDLTPYMPNIIPKAYLKNYTGGSVNFQWNLRIQWESPGGRKFDDSFPGNTVASNSDVSSWVVNWREITRGGDEITLDVTATAGGKVYDKTVNHGFKIGGLNDKQIFKSELTLEEQVIAYLESRFKQFTSKGDFPVWGTPRGYGIMQLDTPPATDEEVWNWRENIAEGKARFAQKKSVASAQPSKVKQKGGVYRFASEYTQQELLTDAFQLYNGYHYWVWNSNKWIPLTGYWKKDPKLGINYGRDYGGPAIKIYYDVQNGNPPPDWN